MFIGSRRPVAVGMLSMLLFVFALIPGALAEDPPPEPLTSTPSPSETLTPAPTDTFSPTSTETLLPTATDTAIAVPTQTYTVETPTEAVEPTLTETLPTIETATLEHTPSLTPVETITLTETSTPVSTETAIPSVTPTATQSPFGPEPPLQLFFTDSFDSSELYTWTLGSGWALTPSEGGSALSVSESDTPVTFVHDTLLDIAASARFLFETGTARMSIRQSDAGAYTALLSADGQVALYRGGALLGAAEVISTEPGQWRTLRVSAIGTIVRVSVDGSEVLAVEDPTPLPAGALSFASIGSMPMLVDDFELWMLVSADATATPSSTPQPTAELSFIEPEMTVIYSHNFNLDPNYGLYGTYWPTTEINGENSLYINRQSRTTRVGVNRPVDVMVQSMVLIQQGEWELGLRRSEDLAAGYTIRINTAGEVTLFRSGQPIDNVLIDVSLMQTWLDLRFVAVDDFLSFSVNGERILLTQDPDPLPSGQVTFATGDATSPSIWMKGLQISVPSDSPIAQQDPQAESFQPHADTMQSLTTSTMDPHKRLVTMTLQGTHIISSEATFQIGDELALRFTPDGSHIVIPSGGTAIKNIHDYQTNPQDMEVLFPGWVGEPTWSSDTLQVAMGIIAAADYGIWILDTTGSIPPWRLTDQGVSPAWAGDYIFFTGQDGGIFRIKADGSEPQPVEISSGIYDKNPTAFSDQSGNIWLAYETDAPNEPDCERDYDNKGIQIMRMLADGTLTDQKLFYPSYVCTYFDFGPSRYERPFWSPDGSRLLYFRGHIVPWDFYFSIASVAKNDIVNAPGNQVTGLNERELAGFSNWQPMSWHVGWNTTHRYVMCDLPEPLHVRSAPTFDPGTIVDTLSGGETVYYLGDFPGLVPHPDNDLEYQFIEAIYQGRIHYVAKHSIDPLTSEQVDFLVNDEADTGCEPPPICPAPDGELSTISSTTTYSDECPPLLPEDQCPELETFYSGGPFPDFRDLLTAQNTDDDHRIRCLTIYRPIIMAAIIHELSLTRFEGIERRRYYSMHQFDELVGETYHGFIDGLPEEDVPPISLEEATITSDELSPFSEATNPHDLRYLFARSIVNMIVIYGDGNPVPTNPMNGFGTNYYSTVRDDWMGSSNFCGGQPLTSIRGRPPFCANLIWYRSIVFTLNMAQEDLYELAQIVDQAILDTVSGVSDPTNGAYNAKPANIRYETYTILEDGVRITIEHKPECYQPPIGPPASAEAYVFETYVQWLSGVVWGSYINTCPDHHLFNRPLRGSGDIWDHDNLRLRPPAIYPNDCVRGEETIDRAYMRHLQSILSENTFTDLIAPPEPDSTDLIDPQKPDFTEFNNDQTLFGLGGQHSVHTHALWVEQGNDNDIKSLRWKTFRFQEPRRSDNALTYPITGSEFVTSTDANFILDCGGE